MHVLPHVKKGFRAQERDFGGVFISQETPAAPHNMKRPWQKARAERIYIYVFTDSSLEKQLS